MKKSTDQEIPASNINGYGIGADLSSLNGKGKILFVDPRCFVVGLENTPHAVFMTTEFPKVDLPIYISKNIYDVKELILQATFNTEIKQNKNFLLPKWLAKFKKLELLKLDHANLDDLNHFNDIPVQHLIIVNVKYNSADRLIAAIKQFKQLNEISYDRSLPANLIDAFKRLNLKLNLIPDKK